jgi:hypothetical protein
MSGYWKHPLVVLPDGMHLPGTARKCGASGCRAVAVIDPEDHDDLMRLWSCLVNVNPRNNVPSEPTLQDALRAFAAPAEPEPTVTDAEARAMRKALARLARRENQR